MATISKATGKPFDFFNLAINTFYNGIGHAMMNIGNDILKVGS